jgi:23S rRNA (uracil1939-C5)-methyltransferase
MKRTKRRKPRAPAPPVTLEIEKLVYGGDGLARREGIIYFVPFVLPGEQIRARPVDPRKNFVRAQVAEILKPSPARIAPPCPHFTACGGCQYQHIDYERQVEAKSEILRETLNRIGHVSWDGPVDLHPSPPYGYRNRVQWKVRQLNAAVPESGPDDRSLALGYFHAGSNQLCPVDECAVLAPPLGEALVALKAELRSGALPAEIREIAAFAAHDGDLLLNVSFTTLPDAPQRLARRFRAAVPAARSVLLQETAGERMELDGPGFLHYEVGGTGYQVGHMSFFQVNRFLIDPMVEAVTTGPGEGLALDLYAGVGLFSVPLARRFGRVVAVEADPAAARDLEENLQSVGDAAQAVNAEAETFLADWHERPELVVLDPPRAGVPPEALAALARLKPGRIHYLSCDPSTLARDLGELAKAGYRIAELHLFDVFPQTFHIETLTVLKPEP